MTPTDLMVGDWVMLFDDIPTRVDAIGDVKIYLTDNQGYEWHSEYPFIKPIPLTRAILEKNGFRWLSTEENYGSSGRSVSRYSFPLGQGFNIEEWDDNTFLLTDHCFMRFRYVHEFQHVLRMCYISKEITI